LPAEHYTHGISLFKITVVHAANRNVGESDGKKKLKESFQHRRIQGSRFNILFMKDVMILPFGVELAVDFVVREKLPER
jgi:hypothetical protein